MLGEAALELLPVGDVGERVVRRRPRQGVPLAPLLADVAEGPDRSRAGVVAAHRRAEQLAPEPAAVAAHELDLLAEDTADAERRGHARSQPFVELVAGVDDSRRLAVEARALVAEQAIELVADELEPAVAREGDPDRCLGHHGAHLGEQQLAGRLARLALAHHVLEDLRELAELAAEVGPAAGDVGILGDQLQRALLQPGQRSQQVERDQQRQRAAADGDAEGEPARALLALDDAAEERVGPTGSKHQPVGVGDAGDADVVVAGADRIAGRLDRAAALAPVLQRGGDHRVGGAVAKDPVARRMREDAAARVDDDRHQRRTPVRRVLRQVVEKRPARQAQRPAEHRGDAAFAIEHRHRQDHDRLARDARRAHLRDDRPLLAQGVLEVVAVGDAAVRVARALLVVDEEDGPVGRDDEDAREERRQDRLALDEFSQPRGVGQGGRGNLQGDAAQRPLQADQALRDRRRQPARVVLLRVEDDLLAAAPDLAQHEDDRQRHAREDQQRARQREADLQRAKTEGFPGRAHSCVFGATPSFSHRGDAICVKLMRFGAKA